MKISYQYLTTDELDISIKDIFDYIKFLHTDSDMSIKSTLSYVEEWQLNKEEIIKQLEYISQKNDNADIVLVCYEKKGDFCHRHILTEWLGSDYNIEELSFE